MLRTLFDGLRAPLWPLQRELDVLLALHRLYALRDDERHRLEADVGDAPRVDVPPLILLPLFENALTHGGEGAPMRLAARAADGELVVELWNAGEPGPRREAGTGITTTERRLALAYGPAATVAVEARERDGVAGTGARLTLPLTNRTISLPPVMSP